MDHTDQNIISALRDNALTSLPDLAHRLGVSRTTVRSWIERLQQ
jgi:DNA-binding Lrp family transcriptional regulator